VSRRPVGPPDRLDPARDCVAQRLTAQAELFPVLDLSPLDTSGLSDRDAAFAHAIYDAAIERWLTLVWIINQRLRDSGNSVEPALKGILLTAAAQLLFLDRVPPHAAIDEAVKWAKVRIREGAAGIVNAVLRRIADMVFPGDSAAVIPPKHYQDSWNDSRTALPLSDGRALQLVDIELPEDALARLGVATSHGKPLLERWVNAFGIDRARALALHSLAAPPTVVYSSAGRVLTGDGLTPHDEPNHFVFSGDRAALAAFLNANPDAWPQDSSSTAAIIDAVRNWPNAPPDLIIDACAGQGTKTRQLAAAFPAARIVVTDTDPRRFARLQETSAKMPRVRVVQPYDLMKMYTSTANLVLLDVPCTNTGVLARRPEAKYRFDQSQLLRMVDTQRTILVDSLRLLKPEGCLLYTTCSMESEENQAMIDWVTASPELHIVATNSRDPAGLPGDPASQYRDGSFSSLLTTKVPKRRRKSVSR